MSENFPSDVKLNENQNGTVSFATEVVATIAGLAVTEVDGVASMTSQSSGFADMFSRKKDRNFTKGVRIDLDGEQVTVDVTMVVEYGSPVPEVARNIQENVKKAIETMTGLDVHSVDVHVTGISFEREQRTNAELDEQQRKMLERSESEKAEPAAQEPETAEEEDAAETVVVVPEEEPVDEDEEEIPEAGEEAEPEDEAEDEYDDEYEDDDEDDEIIEVQMVTEDPDAEEEDDEEEDDEEEDDEELADVDEEEA